MFPEKIFLFGCNTAKPCYIIPKTEHAVSPFRRGGPGNFGETIAMNRTPRIGFTTLRQVILGLKGEEYVRYIYPNNYAAAVYRAGGLPVAIPAFVEEPYLDDYLDMVDGLLLIGGPDIPPSFYGEKDNGKVHPMPEDVAVNHLTLIKKAFSRTIPVLGVCLGAQELNVAAGGGLLQDLEEFVFYHRTGGRDQYHKGVIAPGSRLAEILGAGEVLLNSCHHQAIDPARLGKDARVTVTCGEVVEGIEFAGDVFRVGVQWHPERILDEPHRRKLFSAFISEARKN